MESKNIDLRITETHAFGHRWRKQLVSGQKEIYLAALTNWFIRVRICLRF